MAKIEVTVDEKWPVFSVVPLKEGNEDYQFDIPDEMYKNYLYIMLKFHEFQLQLQALYAEGNRKLSEKCCGHSFPEGSKPDEQYKLNKIRNELTQT